MITREFIENKPDNMTVINLFLREAYNGPLPKEFTFRGTRFRQGVGGSYWAPDKFGNYTEMSQPFMLWVRFTDMVWPIEYIDWGDNI